jgi:hypothetical protein
MPLFLIGVLFTAHVSPATLTVDLSVATSSLQSIEKVFTIAQLKSLATEKAQTHGQKVQKFLNVINCESGWDPDAKGDYVAGEPTSFGLAQFHYPGNWGLSTSSAKVPEIALERMAQAWEDDRATEWSCWTP